MQLQCEKEAIKGQKKWVVPWKSWTWIMKTLVFPIQSSDNEHDIETKNI